MLISYRNRRFVYALLLGSLLTGVPAAAEDVTSQSPLVLRTTGTEAAWEASAWSACSSTCGTGTQTRTVVCQLADGTVLPDSTCTTPKPAESQACTANSGCAYTWAAGSFDACTETCGYGTQTRSVWCQDSTGLTMMESLCNAATKPSTTQTCSAYSTCSYTWKIKTGWGACSSSCGPGTQTREVGCIREDGAYVADSFCPAASKPATSQPCDTPCAPCYLNGNYVAHGGSVTAFSAWNAYPNCAAERRYCTNGALSGSYPASTCSVQFAGAGTYYTWLPAGVTGATVRLTGAGGGGAGGADSGQTVGGGGGAGGWLDTSLAVQENTSVAFVLGSGGWGGPAYQSNNTAAGTGGGSAVYLSNASWYVAGGGGGIAQMGTGGYGGWGPSSYGSAGGTGYFRYGGVGGNSGYSWITGAQTGGAAPYGQNGYSGVHGGGGGGGGGSWDGRWRTAGGYGGDGWGMITMW